MLDRALQPRHRRTMTGPIPGGSWIGVSASGATRYREDQRALTVRTVLPSSSERTRPSDRRERRMKTFFPATAPCIEQGGRRVHILDLSRIGAKLYAEFALQLNECLVLDICGTKDNGHVVWATGNKRVLRLPSVFQPTSWRRLAAHTCPILSGKRTGGAYARAVRSLTFACRASPVRRPDNRACAVQGLRGQPSAIVPIVRDHPHPVASRAALEDEDQLRQVS